MNLPTPLRRWFALQLLVLLALIGSALPAWADPPTRVVRVAEVTGSAEWFDPDQRDWAPLLRNQTLTEGDRLRVGNNSRVGLRVGPHAFWLDERSQLELMRLDEQRFDLSLDRGALALRLVTREVARDTLVRTPEGRFTFERAGAYRVDALGSASRGQVFEGRMAFEHRGQDGAPLWLDADQSAEVWWANGPRAERSRLRQDDFGQWLSAAVGFGREEVARYASSRPAYRYVSPELTGADELDDHGRWETTVEFGPIWYPSRVAVGWAPYRDGNWVWSRHWGWTWRDELPWGYATSHYGRWVFWNNRWCWSPGAVRVQRPVFAPALVAWVGGGNVQVGVTIGGRYAPPVAWVPLAPYEVYRPWYRHSADYIRRVNPDPDPHTVRRPTVPGWTGNNRGVPGAVSMYAQMPGNDQAVARPMPVKDDAVLRSFVPLAQAPSRTELPFAGPSRGRMQPDADSPRQRAGGSQGLPQRPFEGHATPPVATANPSPSEAGNLPLRPAPAPWQRGREEAGRNGVPFGGASQGEVSQPAPARTQEVQPSPDVNVPRRIERQERLEREDVWQQRRNPAFERAPEPEMPVRRTEPRPDFRPETRSEPRPESRRDDAMPWRQAPQQQREEAPQRRFEAPQRMEPPPAPRVEMPMRRAEPQPAPQAAPQRRVERDDGVPRKRLENER